MTPAEAPDPLRIVVVASDPLVRAGLAMLLGGTGAVSPVAQAAPADAETVARAHDPDAVVVDLGGDFDEGAPGGVISEVGVAVVALVASAGAAADALAAGARAVIARDGDAETIVAAIGAVARGLVVVDARFEEVLARGRRASTGSAEELTPREHEVLQLLAGGLANKEIARELRISEHTAKFHVNAILGKLGAESRTEAVVLAARLGLVIL